jgi:hypothetical protein
LHGLIEILAIHPAGITACLTQHTLGNGEGRLEFPIAIGIDPNRVRSSDDAGGEGLAR